MTLTPELHKTCPSCSTVKPFSMYYRDASKAFGLASRCKRCEREARIEKKYRTVADPLPDNIPEGFTRELRAPARADAAGN